jgi:hypothetical protein
MIASQDRSYYIGASDTRQVIGNWNTKTFENWWLEKLGFTSNQIHTEAMMAGSAYEHRIIDSLNIPEMEKDKQFISGRLRVNLDGNTLDTIYEIKTYKYQKGFKVPKHYREQVWVEMFGSGLGKAYIVAYGLLEEDYNNFYRDIDPIRRQLFEIQYNDEFINKIYLPRFRYLSDCLDKGRYPRAEEVIFSV